ncbi:hypothetical protein M231_05205 [Tremella mesenterica]|uniref:2,4-dienoyl-CoA reductase n=1 Tax=Tremella mesenterica TaxID=5217 RepID=A0A4Q1BIL5_TREME|nr:hypothetical protein M231_05205 [Tremella mesenterica]
MSVLVPIPTQSLQAGDLYSVKGNVIVVTGGGTGLGRMMTEGFVVNGAKVYIVGRREEVLSKAAEEINQEFGKSGGCVIPVKGDISTKAGAKAIVDIIGSKETHVDTLVNNAAIQVPWKNPITTVEGHNDPEQVERLVWEGVEE